MSKELVAVDRDDVLALHFEALAEFAREHYGSTHEANAYYADKATLWNVTPEVAEERMWEFNRAGLHATFKPKAGSIEALTRLSARYNFAVVSKQIKDNVKAVEEWTTRLFPEIFEAIYFTHPFEGDTRTKTDVCMEIGAVALIDDALKDCISMAEVGKLGLWFGGYGDAGSDLPSGLITVKDWAAVERYLNERAS
jgi:hypothetical protein